MFGLFVTGASLHVIPRAPELDPIHIQRTQPSSSFIAVSETLGWIWSVLAGSHLSRLRRFKLSASDEDDSM
ncbi:zinc carboxypeptidase [Aspergillus luchuensis]|uniref:Zinc carboxypeptidase n=1 Tax=Aspergillus kawachii TaxID=1069201 RepID=A0A146FUI9_ASPKA|nr:zinc carboxypeptidase [Aspergillus luchuensis]